MANVNLGSVFDEYVQEKVESGHYSDPDEVIREGLRLLMQQDREREAKIGWLRGEIQKGLDSPVREWEGMDEIFRMAEERRAGH